VGTLQLACGFALFFGLRNISALVTLHDTYSAIGDWAALCAWHALGAFIYTSFFSFSALSYLPSVTIDLLLAGTIRTSLFN
jgi:hypothetical protein